LHPSTVANAPNSSSNISPPYSNQSSDEVQRLLADSPSEATAASPIHSPSKASPNRPLQHPPARQNSYTRGFKDYPESSGQYKSSHQIEDHDPYYRPPPRKDEFHDRRMSYSISRYPNPRSPDSARIVQDWEVRHDWVSPSENREHDRHSRVDNRHIPPVPPASSPYDRRRRSPTPPPRRPLSPSRPLDIRAYPYGYSDDSRGLKRPREDTYDVDMRRMPPPSWNDRDAYERGGPPPFFPDGRPYLIDHRDPRYPERHSPPPINREPYSRYERAYGRPMSPEFGGPGPERYHTWYSEGQRDPQSYRR